MFFNGMIKAKAGKSDLHITATTHSQAQLDKQNSCLAAFGHHYANCFGPVNMTQTI